MDRVRVQGAPQLITLVGVPGIGKSRLVWELLRHVHARPELVYWRQGRALAYGGGAFGAVAEAVRAHLGVLESDGPAEIETKMTAALEALFPDARTRGWLAGRVRPLVGLGGDAAGGREESFAAWQRLIEAIADHVPLVLVLEDLHWADDGTLDFVEHLVDWTSDVPLLVLCTSRPELLERRPSWGGGRLNSLTVALSPLSEEASAELLAELLGRPALEAGAQARLLHQAGGNPLYAEEYARMFGAAAGTELPDSVQGIIAARLDLLDPLEKQLLQNASVLGKVFWRGGVEALGTNATDDLVQRLVRKEFLRRERGSSIAGEQELAFRHALVRDVVYAQLPRAARAEKHRLAAEWIEATSASRPDLVAHHYLEALAIAGAAGADAGALGVPARASLRAAGDRAQSLGAYHDAIELYRRALELDPGDEERRELLGAVLAPASAALDPDAWTWAEAALEACEASGDLAGAADAETALSSIAWYAGDAEEEIRHGERAIELAERGGSDSALARALAERARHLMLADRHEEAIDLGSRAIELALRAGLEDIAVDALVTVGTARGNQGDEEALAILGDALERARAANAPVPMFRALNNSVFLIHRQYGPAASLPIRDEIEQEVLRGYGMLSTLRWFDSDAAWNAYQAGDWDESLRRAESFWRRSTQPHRLEVVVLIATASIAAGRGDDRGAWADLERALARARDSEELYVAQALVYATRLASLTGRRGEEQRFFAELARCAPSALTAATESTTELAWLAVDFERPFELAPSRSVWREAYDAILDGRLAEATGILDATGVATEAAYVRLRRARAEPGPWLDEAEAFYTDVRATRYLREVADLRAGATRRSA
jgi:tetratricopeptide (TPR) repeat protein